MRTLVRPSHVAVILAGLCTTLVAAADPSQSRNFERSQFHGKAEFGLGVLGLPTAAVCTNREQFACKRGDGSPMLELWQLFRPNPMFAAGAGITIGLFPITDAAKLEPVGISRDHKRGYLTAEAIARLYWLHGPVWESWVAATGGLVVVSDTYVTNNNATDRAYIGPHGVTIRSEGYTMGIAAGVAKALSDNWSLGASLRYALWSLPVTPARDTLGDEASLVGRNGTLIIGISVGYRLKL